MANKNTKSLRRFSNAARKKNHGVVEYQKPVPNYHSHSGSLSTFCTTARLELRSSNSPKRNMEQKILINKNEDGSKHSITRHVPIDSGRPVQFKGHAYVAELGLYQQPKGIIR